MFVRVHVRVLVLVGVRVHVLVRVGGRVGGHLPWPFVLPSPHDRKSTRHPHPRT
jgi:hypothetical protein